MADISDFTMFVIFMVVICGPVIFFWGPAMWSSDTEFVFFRLWRWLRGKKRAGHGKPFDGTESSNDKN